MFTVFDPVTIGDLWLLPLKEPRIPHILLKTSFSEADGQFSPDGKWIAYVSDASGVDQVNVRSAMPGGGRLQVSVETANRPRWSKDGRELIFTAGPKFYAVEISTKNGQLRSSKPRLLFSLLSRPASYDITKDGFVTLTNPYIQNPPRSVNVVLNWKSELTTVKP